MSSPVRLAIVSSLFNKSKRRYCVVTTLAVLVCMVIYFGQTDLTATLNNKKNNNNNNNVLASRVWSDMHFEEESNHRTDQQKLQPQTCTERKHVLFVKVPKTGSATISSILIHFGMSRKLTFALPAKDNHFGRAPLSRSMIAPIPKGKQYEILVHHSTYSRKTKKEIFPNDTFVMASVREPFSSFLSSYYYFRYVNILPKDIRNSKNETNNIEAFLNLKYRDMKSENETWESLAINRQSQRFGVPLSKSRDRKYVDGYIRSVLEKDMDLVLVQEYFDESLILLKRRLCLKIQDLVYIPYHVHSSPRSDHVHSTEIIRKHRELAVAEYMIYDHFYPKFWQHIWKEGPAFFNEVRHFKGILQKVRTFCVRNPTKDESLVMPSSYWNEEFTIGNSRCEDMQIDIAKFGRMQKLRQQESTNF